MCEDQKAFVDMLEALNKAKATGAKLASFILCDDRIGFVVGENMPELLIVALNKGILDILSAPLPIDEAIACAGEFMLREFGGNNIIH